MFLEFFVYFAGLAMIKGSIILDIVPRTGWHAKAPLAIEPMPNPVPYVVIHHSYQPAACYTHEDCENAMHWMQDLHQINNSWNDIGYHFAVGGDKRAYEGRGWTRVGAHAPGYNNISIGICVIGDWRDELPPPQQLEVVQLLIDYGVRNGYIREDYKLLGHRQVRDTECPGDSLFREITTWEHWVEAPNQDYRRSDSTKEGAGTKKLKGFYKKKT